MPSQILPGGGECEKIIDEETALPMKQIMSRVGVRERRQFWMLFKKHLGMSPCCQRQSVNTGRIF